MRLAQDRAEMASLRIPSLREKVPQKKKTRNPKTLGEPGLELHAKGAAKLKADAAWKGMALIEAEGLGFGGCLGACLV